MSKIITVFGATGKQGGSVIRAILSDTSLSSQFKIRGVTRDSSKPAAQALLNQGVDVKIVSRIVRLSISRWTGRIKMKVMLIRALRPI
jgi:uncharacterized protein YbjT (DUF2867 family)